jgi:hypothetical protein
MVFAFGFGSGFVFGWLFFKRPEVIEKAWNWIKDKAKALWHRVF